MASRSWIIGLLVIVSLISGWGGVARAAEAGEHPRDGGRISIGYSSSLFVGVDRKDAQAAIDMWMIELARTAGLEAKITATIYDDLEQIAAVIRQRTIDFVAMTTLDFLRIKNQVPIEPVLIATNRGKAGEEYALVIHKGAPYTELKQLRGKTLLVEKSSGGCINARLWLDTELMSQKLPPSQAFFQSAKLVDHASQAVLPVFFRQADACLMPRWSYDIMVELNPQVKDQTSILALPRFWPGEPFHGQRHQSARCQDLRNPAVQRGGAAPAELFKQIASWMSNPPILERRRRLFNRSLAYTGLGSQQVLRDELEGISRCQPQAMPLNLLRW